MTSQVKLGQVESGQNKKEIFCINIFFKLDQMILAQKFLGPKIFLDIIFFVALIFGQEIFLTKYFVGT